MNTTKLCLKTPYDGLPCPSHALSVPTFDGLGSPSYGPFWSFQAKPQTVLTTFLLVLATLLPVIGQVHAQESNRDGSVEEPDGSDQVAADAEFQILTERIPRYVMTTEEESPADFVFHEDPLQRWSNPLRRTKDACTFLWTHQGRPAIVMAAYWTSDTVFWHEFQTLYSAPLSTEVDGNVIWTPRKPGVFFKPYPESQRVSSKRPVRLAQMRSIASSFKAFLGPPQAPKFALRLLRHPLYRYPSTVNADGLVDGALFAYVTATDPDMFVLIEARKDEGQDDAAWHVGFARMAQSGQFVRFGEDVFWQVTGSQHWKQSNNYRQVKLMAPAPSPPPTNEDEESEKSSGDATNANASGEADTASINERS